MTARKTDAQGIKTAEQYSRKKHSGVFFFLISLLLIFNLKI